MLLHAVEPGAGPGAGQRGGDESQRVPVGAELGTCVPRCGGAGGAGDEAHDAKDHGVAQGSIGGEPGRKVAAENAEGNAISQREARTGRRTSVRPRAGTHRWNA